MTNDEELTRTNANLQFEELDTPTKSKFDKKEYRVIRLKNGLTASLSSDMATTVDKMAAACLSISVGSFSDPKNIPGMAHFLEHMVFMGSEKYPAENDFISFISSKGGSYNAHTGNEFTDFYFVCLKEDLFLALDKLSQFLIAPLMLKNSINREIEAIDTEYQMGKTSEEVRKFQLIESFRREDVPINTFNCGNSTTLKQNVSEDNLYEQVHKFRKTHYSAHRMMLAVQATFPLDILEKWVVELFGQIASNQKPVTDLSHFSNLFDTEAFKKMYYMEPISKITEVNLVWCLPSFLRKYHTKPAYIVGWILDHEGVGSLLSYLKKKVWALNLTFSIDDKSFYSIFTVHILLTDDGLKNLSNVIESVFSYIKLMQNQGPQEIFFKETQTLCDKKFEYAPERDAYSIVCELVSNMHFCTPKEYLTGNRLLFTYDPKELKKVVDSLVVEKANILVGCNELPKHLSYNKTEKWYGTKYCEAEITKEQVEQWKNPKVIAELALPQPNQFIPTNFAILEKSETHSLYPEQIIMNESFELWYRQDQTFELPYAVYNFYFINPISKESAFMYIQMEIYINLLSLMLEDELYPATLAGIHHNIDTEDFGISITISGFNEKLHMVLDLIIKYILNFNTYLTDDIFKVVKEHMVKSYYNALLNPNQLGSDCHYKILENRYFLMLEKYNASFSLTIDTTKKFAIDFFQNLYIKALIQGNVSKNNAMEIARKVVTSLNYHPTTKKLNCQIRELPKGESICVLESFNKNDPMSDVLCYYQSDNFSLKEFVIIELIVMIIDTHVFDQLRTKEQLGYAVSSTIVKTYGVLGLSVVVKCQKSKYSSQYVNQRIDNFMELCVAILKDMTELDFEQRKNDIIKVLECPDLDIFSECSRNWKEITEGDYFFNRTQEKIKELRLVQLEDLQNWWKTRCLVGNDLRKLSVQVRGFDTGTTCENEVKKQHEELKLRYLFDDTENYGKSYLMKNIEEFNNTLTLFPVICKHSAQTDSHH